MLLLKQKFKICLGINNFIPMDFFKKNKLEYESTLNLY